MDEYYAKQLELHKKMANSFANFKAKGKAYMTIGNYQSRLAGLETFFANLNSNHDKILRLPKLDPNHDYFTSNLYDLAEETYFDRKGEFMDFFVSLETNSTPPSPAQPGPQPIDIEALLKASFVQSLPQVEIPKFSGKYSDWESFKDLFRSTIHRRDDLSSVMKLLHLRTLLTDEALDKVKSLPIKDENYTKAWDILTRYYENHRRLVDAYLTDFASIKPMKTESSSELKRLMKETMAPLNSLSALEQPVERWSAILVFFTVSRFDSGTRKDWERHLGETVETPTWAQLKAFTNGQLLTLEAVERGVKANQAVSSKSSFSSHKPSKGNNLSTHTVNLSSQKSSKRENQPNQICSCCKQSHYIARCVVFKDKPLQERKEFVKQSSLCFNCLGKHTSQACKSERRCFTCRGKHHTLLHMPTTDVRPLEVPTAHVSTQQATSTLLDHQAASMKVPRTIFTQVLLATARVYVESSRGLRILVRALIDQCFQVSIVSQSLCQRLNLKHKALHVPIQGVGNNTAAISSEVVHFFIKPHFESDFSCEVQALVLPRVSAYSPPTVQGNLELSHLENLDLADPNYMEKGHIDLLLGASIHAQIIDGRVIRGRANEPIASLSSLGWLVSGSCPPPNSDSHTEAVSSHCVQLPPLDEILERFWLVEEIPKAKLHTAEEQECENYFLATHSRDPSGRYIVRLPFKKSTDSRPFLGDSYTTALRSLQRMESRFQKDEKLKEAYLKFMLEYEQLNHMILASNAPTHKEVSESFFLPHHGMWKEASTTTKLRTVFNGSARTKSGKSLNDLLHAGPNLLPNLVDLVSRWRIYKYVFSADVEKMYRQILLREEDQHFQSILWRVDSTLPIDIFRLRTVTYGLLTSTFIARVLKQLATDHASEYALGAEVLREEVHMDDVLSGAHSLTEAFKKQSEVIGILRVGGFPIRKWSSNHLELIEWLPPEMLALDPLTFFDNSTSLVVLGISWCPLKDKFCFNIDFQSFSSVVTKRSVLSSIARIFDPMGWLSPIVISAKILMQYLWLLKLGYDGTLPENLISTWRSWHQSLHTLSSIQLPRWSCYSPQAQTVEIHGFADASKDAYAEVIYLRVLHESQVFVTLQIAKTRVAPLKTLSIPKLELCAAHTLAKLVKHFTDVVPIPCNSIHLWSDSTDVLCWLKDRPSRWPVFVANRCSDILTLMSNAFWHQVRSRENPADVASRGIEPFNLPNHNLWWKGPEWLSENLSPWPISDSFAAANNPVNSCNVLNLSSSLEKTVPTTLQLSSSSLDSHLWDLVDNCSSIEKFSGSPPIAYDS